MRGRMHVRGGRSMSGCVGKLPIRRVHLTLTLTLTLVRSASSQPLTLALLDCSELIYGVKKIVSFISTATTIDQGTVICSGLTLTRHIEPRIDAQKPINPNPNPSSIPPSHTQSIILTQILTLQNSVPEPSPFHSCVKKSNLTPDLSHRPWHSI